MPTNDVVSSVGESNNSQLWRRSQWARELDRHREQLSSIKPYINTELNELFSSNANKYRQRVKQIYVQQQQQIIHNDNKALALRLNTVHNRVPLNEYSIRHSNNATNDRNNHRQVAKILYNKQLSEDNQRLVHRLVNVKPHSESAIQSWKKHASMHDDMIKRFNRVPKNCYRPNINHKNNNKSHHSNTSSINNGHIKHEDNDKQHTQHNGNNYDNDNHNIECNENNQLDYTMPQHNVNDSTIDLIYSQQVNRPHSQILPRRPPTLNDYRKHSITSQALHTNNNTHRSQSANVTSYTQQRTIINIQHQHQHQHHTQPQPINRHSNHFISYFMSYNPEQLVQAVKQASQTNTARQTYIDSDVNEQ